MAICVTCFFDEQQMALGVELTLPLCGPPVPEVETAGQPSTLSRGPTSSALQRQSVGGQNRLTELLCDTAVQAASAPCLCV